MAIEVYIQLTMRLQDSIGVRLETSKKSAKSRKQGINLRWLLRTFSIISQMQSAGYDTHLCPLITLRGERNA